jgi:hypothetical protein
LSHSKTAGPKIPCGSSEAIATALRTLGIATNPATTLRRVIIVESS